MTRKTAHQGFITALMVTIVAIELLAKATASENVVLPEHDLSVTIPDGWERRSEVHDPIIFVAVERGTGNSFGIWAFKHPDAKFTLIRKSAETGLLNELGPTGKILQRVDTKLLGVPAYCVIAETEFQGHTISIARIMAEHPLNGFVYVAQGSKMMGGDFDSASIQAIVDRLKLKESK